MEICRLQFEHLHHHHPHPHPHLRLLLQPSPPPHLDLNPLIHWSLLALELRETNLPCWPEQDGWILSQLMKPILNNKKR